MRRSGSGGKPVRVYEVLADIDGEGPACDGTEVFRFRDEGEALAFAKRSTCYGRPAVAHACDAPRVLARRWGLA